MKPVDLLFPKEAARKRLDICPTCGTPKASSTIGDSPSKQEFLISGMCQTCQDKVFGPTPDDEPDLDDGTGEGWNE